MSNARACSSRSSRWPTTRRRRTDCSPTPAGGDSRERPLDLGNAERGGRGRHDEIARQRDLTPAGESGTVDGGDQRLGALALHDAGEPAALRLQFTRLAGRDRLEVGTGGE